MLILYLFFFYVTLVRLTLVILKCTGLDMTYLLFTYYILFKSLFRLFVDLYSGPGLYTMIYSFTLLCQNGYTIHIRLSDCSRVVVTARVYSFLAPH